MSRYHVTLTNEQVRKALHQFIQDELYPNRTVGDAVYFSHDLMTGEMLVELSYPLPLDEYEEDLDWDDDEEDEPMETANDNEDLEWDDIPLSKFVFTQRASALFNILGASTVGEAYDKILSKGPNIALRTPNMGPKTVRHMAYIIRKAMSGLVIDGVYYAPAQQKFHDYLNTTYKLQPGIDDLSEERSDE